MLDPRLNPTLGITGALAALSNPDVLARMALAKIGPSRDQCVECHQAIPPGKAGRKCKPCREGQRPAQQHHLAVLDWLRTEKLVPRLDRTEKSARIGFYTPEGESATLAFFAHFQDELEALQVEALEPLQVSLRTSDYDVHRGDQLVWWDGQTWELRPTQPRVGPVQTS